MFSIPRSLVSIGTVAGLVVAGIIGTGAGVASACGRDNNSDHCYIISGLTNSSNHGMYGTLHIHCLFSPTTNNFVNQEIWDGDSAFTDWVEVGVNDGVDSNGDDHNQGWFWADSRPGGGYNEHFLGTQVTLDTNHDVQMQKNGSSSWTVWGGNSFHQIGTSNSNTMTGFVGEAGSEYTSNNGSGMRDVGSAGALEYQDSSNNFHSWGSQGLNAPEGPGHWVTGSYSSATSTESWSTAC